MADNETKTTEVPNKEDDLQTQDNFKSPLELDELGLTQRKDKQRISSSSSSKSKDETRKRTKLGSVEENEENTSDSDEEWSEEEFTVSFKNAPVSVWARGMSFLRSSVNSLKQSSNALQVELQSIREDFINFRNDNDRRMESLEKSVSHVSDKFENWRDKKSVLLSQIAEMRTEYE